MALVLILVLALAHHVLVSRSPTKWAPLYWLFTFLAMVALAAWYGGGGPGALATLLSGVYAASFVLLPRTEFLSVGEAQDIFALVLFFVIGFLISVFSAGRTEA